MELKFREEKREDYIQVFRLNQLVFERDAEAKLVDALRQNPKAFIPELSIVAKLDDKLVGYILFTKNFITNSKGEKHDSLTLAPLSVHPKYQHKGIGTQLLQKGLAKANYGKFGFTSCYNWGIRTSFEIPEDTLMAMELSKNGLRGVQGVISYPKEFDLV